MRNISNLFYFGTTLYEAHVSDGLSVHHQDCTYRIRYMSYRFCGCLLASSHRTCMTHIWCCMYSPDDGRRDRPKHVPRRVLFQNKINLRYCAYGWFYYRSIILLLCKLHILIIRYNITRILCYVFLQCVYHTNYASICSSFLVSWRNLSPLFFDIRRYNALGFKPLNKTTCET